MMRSDTLDIARPVGARLANGLSKKRGRSCPLDGAWRLCPDDDAEAELKHGKWLTQGGALLNYLATRERSWPSSHS